MTDPIPLRPVQPVEGPFFVLIGGLAEPFPTEAAATSAAVAAAKKTPGAEIILYAPTRRFRAELTVSTS